MKRLPLGPCRRLVAAAALALAGCMLGDTQIKIERSPAYDKAGRGVSVLGAYRGGRLSPAYWDQIGPEISQALGAERCEPLFGERLRREDRALFEQIDSTTKDDGVTSELLGRLAPRAPGGTILALTIYSRPVGEGGGGPPGRGRNRLGRTPRRRGQAVAAPPSTVERAALEVSLSLFSAAAHDSVAALEMRYTGDNMEEALKKLVDRFRLEFPGLSCAPWTWPGADAAPAAPSP